MRKEKMCIRDRDMEDTGTNKYQKLVKSGIGSIIYSHSATDIPVHLSPGKYILKSVDPKTGAITVQLVVLSTSNTLSESLILAQDERWRRA